MGKRTCPNGFAKSVWLWLNGRRHFRVSTHTRILDVSLGSPLVLLDIPFTKDKILKKIEGLSEQWSESDEAKRG